jgi:hypothetical protein
MVRVPTQEGAYRRMRTGLRYTLEAMQLSLRALSWLRTPDATLTMQMRVHQTCKCVNPGPHCDAARPLLPELLHR